MPLSTVLGAQSLIKPGVCTTATRPASPYTGQAIYDTTTASQLIYNGTAFVDTGGLAYISTTSFSSNTVQFQNCFTSAYTNYRAVFNYTSTLGIATYMRYLVGGTVQTATIFSLVTGIQQSVPNTFTGSGRSDQYALWGTAYATYPTVLTCDFLSPQEVSYTNYQMSFTTGLSGSDLIGGDGYGRNAATTQIDGFEITTASAYGLTGTMTMYGYRK